MLIVILGRGGHARVLEETFAGNTVKIGKDEKIPERYDGVLIGLGDLAKRKKLFEEYADSVVNAIHDKAIIADDVELGVGIQVMAGVVIQPGARIGRNTIINTRASIDHDCLIGSHCHIAPGAILCGNVTVGDETFVGAGSIITEGVTIGSRMFVPAGSLISRNGYCKRYISA